MKLRIKILDATLFITQVELKPPLLLAHANVLGMKCKAHYPVTYTLIKILLRVLGSSRSLSIMHSLDKYRIGFYLLWLRTAFFGSASTNPFHFHYYDMTNLVLYVNGVQHRAEPLTMDCSSPF
jgi:hypothetical protein